MKLTVIGAGAIGSMFGGLVKQRHPEFEVLFIGRGEHGQAIRDAGHVVLEGPWGVYQVPVGFSHRLEDVAGSDLALLTVKSQATEETIRAAAPYLGRAILVSIQNGINSRLLAPYVAADRLVLGITATNMAVHSPGRVSLQLAGATLLGSPPGGAAAAAAQRAADVLRAGGLKVHVHANVLGVQYNKLAVNALGYASVLSRSNFITQAVLHRPWREVVGRPILDECLAAFRRAGIDLAPIPGVPDVARFRRVLKLLDGPLLGPPISLLAKALFNRKPIVFSLYQDLLRGKRTEIDYVNGEIVRLAQEHGLEAPANALVVDLVHELEAQPPGTFFSREEVLKRFASPALCGKT